MACGPSRSVPVEDAAAPTLGLFEQRCPRCSRWNGTDSLGQMPLFILVFLSVWIGFCLDPSFAERFKALDWPLQFCPGWLGCIY